LAIHLVKREVARDIGFGSCDANRWIGFGLFGTLREMPFNQQNHISVVQDFVVGQK
jgi:hypothetical protein